jgi:hypothetical protein
MKAMEQSTKLKVQDLNEIYTNADSVDQEVFSEQRSNILLISGDHYNRRFSNFFRRVRDTKDLTQEQKLRLTKNHTQKIVKGYVNTILGAAPGVGFRPSNESELQDQKSAELNHAVWQCEVNKSNIHAKVDLWANDFCGVGEVATKIFFDPTEGEVRGYQPLMDESGQPALNEMGQPAPDMNKPVMKGKFIFEQIYGFNLLRAPEARTMEESPYLILRKMVSRKDLLKKYEGDEAKQKMFQASSDKTFVVFDSARSSYEKNKDQVLVKEIFYRPCIKYPQGYFAFYTELGIFEEGELPGGIFPIVHEMFDVYQTVPRGHSIVKTLRPYQIEINRAASKMAEHQITLGDDKLILQNGAKVSAGVSLPGVRTVSVTGQSPTILAGRDGSQYLNYMTSQISEMYGVADMDESDPETAQLDPYVLLFRAAKHKKKFKRYIARFERFLVNVCKTYLQLAKIYLTDEDIVYAIGRSEQINIAEFKNTQDINYQIVVEPQADDIETKLGRQLVLNHTLQYVGGQLGKEDIGKIMRAMPYANFEESFSDLTIDYDSATNDVLALDRGEVPPIGIYDNHAYMIKRLTARMRQADFKMLDPRIQNNYASRLQAHEVAIVKEQEAIKAANSEFIPTGGYLVTCDFYVADPKDPSKTKRVRLPYESVSWLMKRLETQGSSQEALEQMNQGALAEMSKMFVQQTAPGVPNGMGAPVAG